MQLNLATTIPLSTGKKFLVRHLEGSRLTFKQAIIAKCCECMGGYVDGRTDCRIYECPLYPFMPYREKGGSDDTADPEPMPPEPN